MIRVENLLKQYGSLRAVDGISFEVPEGELFGFLGPNGAGKTTTLSMISGLLKPNQGKVTVGELDVWQAPKAAKRMLGLVPQDLALYEHLTATENLRFWGEMRGLGGAALRGEIADALDLTGLADRARDRVKTFSGGMKFWVVWGR